MLRGLFPPLLTAVDDSGRTADASFAIVLINIPPRATPMRRPPFTVRNFRAESALTGRAVMSSS